MTEIKASGRIVKALADERRGCFVQYRLDCGRLAEALEARRRSLAGR